MDRRTAARGARLGGRHVLVRRGSRHRRLSGICRRSITCHSRCAHSGVAPGTLRSSRVGKRNLTHELEVTARDLVSVDLISMRRDMTSSENHDGLDRGSSARGCDAPTSPFVFIAAPSSRPRARRRCATYPRCRRHMVPLRDVAERPIEPGRTSHRPTTPDPRFLSHGAGQRLSMHSVAPRPTGDLS